MKVKFNVKIKGSMAFVSFDTRREATLWAERNLLDYVIVEVIR